MYINWSSRDSVVLMRLFSGLQIRRDNRNNSGIVETVLMMGLFMFSVEIRETMSRALVIRGY